MSRHLLWLPLLLLAALLVPSTMGDLATTASLSRVDIHNSTTATSTSSTASTAALTSPSTSAVKQTATSTSSTASTAELTPPATSAVKQTATSTSSTQTTTSTAALTSPTTSAVKQTHTSIRTPVTVSGSTNNAVSMYTDVTTSKTSTSPRITTGTLTTMPNITVTSTSATPTTHNSHVQGRVDRCPNKYGRNLGYFRQEDNRCYELRPGVDDWRSAESDCEDTGGTLVVISNAHVQGVVMRLLRELRYLHPVWIGLHDLRTEGDWEWIDGTRLTTGTFTDWIPGHRHPVYHNGQDCALMDTSTGKWREVACHSFLFDIQRHPWICEYKIP